MPASNVQWPIPLTRLNPWYPGQMGVPGGWTETGLREHCTGTVFYVDPNHPGATAGSDGTDPTNPLTTVTLALTKVEMYRGDVIVVMAGNTWQYAPGPQIALGDYLLPISEEVTIPYTASGVRIVGLSPSSLGVPWNPASDAGTCITNHACDVIIEGFCFTEGATYTGCSGIYSEWEGTTEFGENMTVRNCHFDSSVATAIEIVYSWYCDIHGNMFQECDYGVYDAAAGNPVLYTVIHDNIFHDCSTSAIALLGGADENFIYNNRIYNASAQAGAAATNEGINLTGGDRSLISDNYFSCVLPGPGAGDWNDFNTGPAASTNAWVNNHCMNGLAVTPPT